MLYVNCQGVVRENAPVVASQIDAMDSGTHVLHSTGVKLRGPYLLSVSPGTTLTFKGACKDANGLWTEWGPLTTASSLVNFTPGATEGSIGSGGTSDLLLSGVSLEWPDLSDGSGIISTRRTLTTAKGPYAIESRTDQWRRARASFHVVMEGLDLYQTQLLHRFYKALSGPLTPFFFDWTDPELGTVESAPTTRYVVRFRDPSMITSLFDVTMSDVKSVYLVQTGGDPEGGDV